MWCLALPALWLGDLLGQNKLACLLSWACRRCMVRYDELGNMLLLADGTADPAAPAPRFSTSHRLAYDMKESHGIDSFLEAIDASPYVRPALLDLGSGSRGVGVAGVERGFLAGVADDFTHFGPLGIIKMLQQIATLFIIDSWPVAAAGVKAVRLFEMRIAENPSFSDGVVSRCSFVGGFLLDKLLSAGQRSDLLQLFVSGIGTDNLVIPVFETRIAFLELVEDLVYVVNVVTRLSITTATKDNMNRVNFR